MKTTIRERFEAKVDRSGPHHCWTGASKPDGTGLLKVTGRMVTARRLAWELERGPLPAGTTVRACPANASCVRVEHLRTADRSGVRSRRERSTPPPSPATPPRGRPRGGSSSETRRRILQSARRSFSTLGYDQTTVADIAAQAAVTSRSIYYYFASKEDLYGALLESVFGEALPMFTAEGMQETTLVRQVSAFYDSAVRYHRDDPTLAGFMVSSLLEIGRHPELREQVDREVQAVARFFHTAVSEARARGELRRDVVPEAVADMLAAVIWGMALFAGTMGTSGQVEAAVEAFKLLLSGDLLP